MHFLFILVDIISHNLSSFQLICKTDISSIRRSHHIPTIMLLHICYILNAKWIYFYLKCLGSIAYSESSQYSNKTVTSGIQWLYDVTFISNVIFIYYVRFSEIITNCNSIQFWLQRKLGSGRIRRKYPTLGFTWNTV